MMPHECPHRRASLFFGRNEEGGIRCVYHGWKFDLTGRCLEMPNEPPGSNYKDKVRARTYPCVEKAGLVWTYMGPRAEPPPFPAFDILDVPGVAENITVFQHEANWLQGLEGDVDTSHFGFLHVGHLPSTTAEEDTYLRYILDDRAPRYKVIDTEFGASYGAYREAGGADRTYWRIAHYLFPFYTMVPVGLLGSTSTLTVRVPMDDEHTLHFTLPVNHESGDVGIAARYDEEDHLEILPNTPDWYGRFRCGRSAANDYKIDRALQRSGKSFTGIPGVFLEDKFITESMGPICDRTQEHLGAADVMVIRVRRRILAAIEAHQEEGVVPPGVDEPEVYRQRSGGIVLPADADWLEATARFREGKATQPEAEIAASAGV